MKLKKQVIIILINCLFWLPIYSQQGKVDTTFNTYDDGLLGDGFDNIVRSIGIQADGKLIVGGDYLNFNGASNAYLCRLFPDGSIDTSFALGTGFNNKVYAVLIQPDGKIIVAGSFTMFNGTAVGRLVRLNSDGTRDPTFNTTVGVTNNIVYGLALQPNGNLIIVGSFTNYNGVAASRVVRVLPNGNFDTSFFIGTGASGLVEEVAIQADGKIIVAGQFVSFNGSSQNKIVRLNTDGSLDSSFGIGTGFDNTVGALAIQSDGKILVGGLFTSYNSSVASRLIRLNTDGSIDSSFLGSKFSTDGVAIITTTITGEIMVGGSFVGTYNGFPVNRLQLLASDGSINPTFDIGAGPATATVYAAITAPDGSWYIGGSFSVFDSQNQGRLAKIDALGTLDVGYLTAGVGFNNSVLKVLPLSDNSTMVVGSFTQFNGVPSPRIAHLSGDGTLDTSYNSTGLGSNNTIRTAVLQADERLYIGGNFTTYNGTLANRIAKITATGSLDSSFNSGLGCNGQVYALAIQPDNKIVIAGNFSTYNGQNAIKIARLFPDGTLDTSFNTGSGAEDGIIEAILIQPDGKIVVAGHFTVFNAMSYNRIVRLNTNGSIDSSFVVGTGCSNIVYALGIQSDGKLLVGGSFLTYNGVAKKRIARLNSNGMDDATFTTGSGFSNGTVRTILVQPDDRLLLGGTFSGTYNSIAVKRMLRLGNNGNYDTNFAVNLNGTVYTIAFTADLKALIGGNFNSVTGITKHRIARLKLCINNSTWNGISWSNGMPSGGKELVFQEDYVLNNAANACSCSIALGKTVTIRSEKSLGLSLDYSGMGTLLLENSATLYQADDEVVNTGSIVLKRQTTPILKTDYTYWASPVLNQQLLAVSPNTLWDKFFSFNANLNEWQTEIPTNLMQKGKGYIIRGPQMFSSTNASIYEAIFSGIPNNGIVTTPIATTDTSNLIGNPYPSAIDADLFLNKNTGIIDGTLYFWTHNTPVANNIYTSNDYACYNGVGGVATSASLNSGVNTNIPSGKIASGQSFFVTSSNGGGTIIFSDAMRVIGQNTDFFKFKKNKKTTLSKTLEKNRVWLNLTNKQGVFKQILIGYLPEATNEYDSRFDGESFDGNDYADFYSINQNQNLVIQGRALPFLISDIVPLGFVSQIEGTFEIAIEKVDGLLTNYHVFIEDTATKTFCNLSNGSYSFGAKAGTFNNRFVLHYGSKILNTTDLPEKEPTLLVAVKNKQISINARDKKIDQVIVYDLLGRLLFNKNHLDCKELLLPNLGIYNQTYIVKVVLENNKIIIKKIAL